MERADYQWHVSFLRPGFNPFILSETHRDFKGIAQDVQVEAISASLVDLNKFSYFDDEKRQLDSIVHHIRFREGTSLRRVFRRVEKNLTGGGSRVIPGLEILVDGTTQYLFAFPDKVFMTADRQFYRG